MDCTASTEYGVQNIFPCTKAINKNPDDSWVTNGEAVGAWIRISLDKTYLVTRIQLRHRARGRNHEKFKGIKVEFSDGAKVEHDLKDNMDMNEVPLTNVHSTEFVKITSMSHVPHPNGWKNSNNGFSDIRIFGCVQGKCSVLF